MTDEKYLTPIQNQALCLLAAGYSSKEAGDQTGVTERTIARWTNKPEFQKLLKQAIVATYDACLAELVSGSREAAQKLKEIISDPDVPSKTKVTAINVLLNNAVRAKESILEERLERLEENLDGVLTEQD